MNRPDLDAWFARADGILREWQGSPDAMHASATADDADPELPLLGDNTADQAWPLPRRAAPRPASRRWPVALGRRVTSPLRAVGSRAISLATRSR